MTGVLPGRRLPGRGPATLYTALMVTAAMLAAIFLITAPPVSPPAIAEFAPAVTQRITDAPPQQAVQPGQAPGRGSGPGSGAGPGGSPTPGAAPTVSPSGSPVPKSFDCVGSPATQIHDPQSPPCVPFWEGDNHGATAPGVSKDEVTIVMPDWSSSSPWVDYQNFFNIHFEFYKRHINIIPVAGLWDGACQPTDQQTFADTVVQKYHPFATLDMTGCSGVFYRDYMANHYKVVSVGYQTLFTEAHLQASRPYLYQYPMANDRMFAQTADWACARLQGAKAVHAGDPTGSLQSQNRVFAGLLADAFFGYATDDQPFATEFNDGCSGSLKHNDRVDGTESTQQLAQDMTNAMLRDKADHVSTIVCFCYWEPLHLAMQAASQQGYYPEWVISDYYDVQIPSFLKLDPTQIANLFGLTFQPMEINEWDDPAIWALNEVDPGGYTTADTGTGGYTDRGTSYDPWYREILLLSSGIQMAGPNLTPVSFEQGLQTTVFPNPRNPIMAGHVGFQGGTHSMTLDAAEWWWSSNGQSPFANDGKGAFCYVDHGARHSAGNWPRGGDPFFPPDAGGQGCYSGAQRVNG